jgi:hypothetical protein
LPRLVADATDLRGVEFLPRVATRHNLLVNRFDNFSILTFDYFAVFA